MQKDYADYARYRDNKKIADLTHERDYTRLRIERNDKHALILLYNGVTRWDFDLTPEQCLEIAKILQDTAMDLQASTDDTD